MESDCHFNCVTRPYAVGDITTVAQNVVVTTDCNGIQRISVLFRYLPFTSVILRSRPCACMAGDKPPAAPCPVPEAQASGNVVREQSHPTHTRMVLSFRASHLFCARSARFGKYCSGTKPPAIRVGKRRHRGPT